MTVLSRQNSKTDLNRNYESRGITINDGGNLSVFNGKYDQQKNTFFRTKTGVLSADKPVKHRHFSNNGKAKDFSRFKLYMKASFSQLEPTTANNSV